MVFMERMVVGHSERFGVPAPPKQTSSGKTKARKQTSKQRLASRVYNTSLDVAALRQQLQELTLHRSLLQTRALYRHSDSDGSAVRIATEYWKVFRRGFQANDPRQAAYLMSVTDEDMRLARGLGRDELLHQWALYTDYFAIRRYEMHSVRVVTTDDATGACITRSEGVFYGAITKKALEVVFPSVLHDIVLTQELLGKEIVMPITLILHFNEDCKWTCHSGEVDLFAALTQLLGDAVKAARIVAIATVAEEGIVVDEVGGHRLPVDPVERTAGTKRQRFTVVEEEDDEKRDRKEEADVRSGQDEIGKTNMNPTEEPEAQATDHDDRNSIAFMLS